MKSLSISLTAYRMLQLVGAGFMKDRVVQLSFGPLCAFYPSSKGGGYGAECSVSDLTRLLLEGLIVRRAPTAKEAAKLKPNSDVLIPTATGIAFLACAKVDDQGTAWTVRRGTLIACRERAILPEMRRQGRTLPVGG